MRRGCGERAARHIRRLILDGGLRQDDRVPQDDIARALGVIRIPAREALLSLEREGRVTIRPHRGAFIGALDEAAVRHHYALYGLVFGFAARRATEHRTPETGGTARRGVPRHRPDRRPRPSRANQGFDRHVLDAANSPRLRTVVRAMVGIVPGGFFALVPGSVEVEQAGSRVICAAVRDGDAAGAEAAYAATPREQGDLVAALFTERQLFG